MLGKVLPGVGRKLGRVSRYTSASPMHDTPAETVYMGESNLAGRIVRVDKAWYGLKESNRIFTEDFKTVLAKQGYVPSTMDSQVYIPACPGQGSEILLMHVDDGLLFYRDDSRAAQIIEAMRARYGPV